MSSRKILLASSAALVLASAAFACGPNFPWQLLDDRAQALKATPVNSFAFEAAHLVPAPTDGLKPVEDPNRAWSSDEDNRQAATKLRTEAEAAGLSVAQAAAVAKMRAAGDGDKAFGLGASLPAAVRLYTAGAVDFQKGRLPQAIARFDAVLALPPADARPRATWAAYMIGRAGGDDPVQVRQQFARVRTLALAGAPDPLGLAVASYGEEAKTYLSDDDQDPVASAKAMAAAAALYAAQAAHGSDIGVQSLRMIAEGILGDRERVDAALDDPLTQRLLIAYAAGDSDNTADDLVPAIELKGADHVAGADRLAAIRYQAGRYDDARELADKLASPLASWVKAKLALQKGDLASAAGFYADATKGFPAADAQASLSPENLQLVMGERATLTLARGEYVEAFEQLYQVGATYWGDAAYVAERVLTLDELKSFVDTRLTALKPVTDANPHGDDTANWGVDPAVALRNLLARRLVRAGRYSEAQAYFTKPADADAVQPDPRTSVAAYADALQRSGSAWRHVDQAEGWYRAASLARHAGMEMMGYEAAPDYAFIGGALEGGIGQTELKGPFVADGERQRFAASAAVPDRRYHYRYIAVDQALKAADLLPPRSQAFAAVLCQATGWALDLDDPWAQQIYRRYVKEGAHVPWAAHFGRDCPEPDFAAAKHLQWIEPVWKTRHFVGRHRWPIGMLVVVLAGTGALLLRRRRRKSA